MDRTLPHLRLLGVAAVAAGLALLSGCGGYDVPGRDRPWPSLGDFPERADAERLEARRRRLIGRYGDPADALPEPSEQPAQPPAGALKIGVIQFARGSGDLDSGAVEVLEQVAAYAQQSRASVWLFGHASQRLELAAAGRGGPASRALAAQRARVVGIALIEAGVPADTITLVTRGGRDPAYRETSEAGEAGNRRVEIYFTK